MKENKTGIVILSRFLSSRLPGKALMEINKKPVLQYIIERLRQVVNVEDIIIATSKLSSDDPIAAFAKSAGVKCFRGSLENVAERFYKAAENEGWEYAARINGDNIFVDTILLKEMLAKAAENKYDFISNVKGRTYPKGMSIEIVRLDYFKRSLAEINKSIQYQEHVTLFLYDHEEGKKHCYFKNKILPEAAGMQLALDTAEDMDRTKNIMTHFTEPHWNYNMENILTIMKTIEHA